MQAFRTSAGSTLGLRGSQTRERALASLLVLDTDQILKRRRHEDLGANSDDHGDAARIDEPGTQPGPRSREACVTCGAPFGKCGGELFDVGVQLPLSVGGAGHRQAMARWDASDDLTEKSLAVIRHRH